MLSIGNRFGDHGLYWTFLLFDARRRSEKHVGALDIPMLDTELLKLWYGKVVHNRFYLSTYQRNGDLSCHVSMLNPSHPHKTILLLSMFKQACSHLPDKSPGHPMSDVPMLRNTHFYWVVCRVQLGLSNLFLDAERIYLVGSGFKSASNQKQLVSWLVPWLGSSLGSLVDMLHMQKHRSPGSASPVSRG